MICAFRLQGIQPPGHPISSSESSQMSPIIDTRHNQSKDEQDDGKTHGLSTYGTASLFPHVNQRTQESENGSRSPNGQSLPLAETREESQEMPRPSY